MSYSTCIKCNNMVSAYEKYCPGCVEEHDLQDKQDLNFHKSRHTNEEINDILIVDGFEIIELDLDDILKAEGFDDSDGPYE